MFIMLSNMCVILSIWFIYMLIRELIFRYFYIFPYTNENGDFANNIEAEEIIKIVSDKIVAPPEIAFVGNSHVIDAINPKTVELIIGKKTFNIAHYYLPFSNSLKILNDNNCFPKYIIVDVSTRYSMFSEIYSDVEYVQEKKHIEKKIKKLFNKYSNFLPSVFVPFAYYNILLRGSRKLIDAKNNKIPTFSRYSPFKRLISYQWALDHNNNHRIVKKIKIEKSYLEKLSELKNLRNSINQTKQLCDRSDKMYIKSMEILDKFLKKACENSCKVIFIRLPLDKRLIEFENKNCSFFFDDIKFGLKKYNFAFYDITLNFTDNNELDFYSDGQHLTEKSSEIVSKNIANFLKTIL